jgi:hypothetical protein
MITFFAYVFSQRKGLKSVKISLNMSHLIPSDPDVRPFLVARSARSVAVWRFSDPLGRVGPGDTQLAREDGLGFPLGALLLLDLPAAEAHQKRHLDIADPTVVRIV